jgi:glycosyltransferase involved in cell wall biosynthesis
VTPTPLLSICIPAYQRPEQLGDAITSVVEQEIDDIEVVVTDDSPEPLNAVVPLIAHPRVRYIRNEQRLGMAANWERAIRLARAPFVGLLMDDDCLLPGFAAAVLDAFEADAAVSVVFTNHCFDDGARRWVRDCPLPGGQYRNFLPYLLEHRPIAVSSMMMTRQAWDLALPLPDLLAADVFIQARVAEARRVFHYIDRPLMVYRCHAGQLTASSSRFRDDGVAVWRQFRFADRHCEALRRRRLSEALASRGKLRLQLGEVAGAHRDLIEAAQLAPLDRRARVAFALSQLPKLSAAAARVWRKWHRRPSESVA